jgi:hypothetical protein
MIFVFHQFKINWLNFIGLTSIIVGKDIRFGHAIIKNMTANIHLRNLTLIRILMLLFIVGYRFLRVRLGKREGHMLIFFKVILCFYCEYLCSILLNFVNYGILCHFIGFVRKHFKRVKAREECFCLLYKLI